MINTSAKLSFVYQKVFGRKRWTEKKAMCWKYYNWTSLERTKCFL